MFDSTWQAAGNLALRPQNHALDRVLKFKKWFVYAADYFRKADQGSANFAIFYSYLVHAGSIAGYPGRAAGLQDYGTDNLITR